MNVGDAWHVLAMTRANINKSVDARRMVCCVGSRTSFLANGRQRMWKCGSRPTRNPQPWTVHRLVPVITPRRKKKRLVPPQKMRCKPAKLLLILLPGSFCFHTPAIAVRDKISLAGSLAWRLAAGPRRVEMCTGKGTDGEIGAKCVEQIDPRKRESENAVANYNIKVSQMEPSCTCWLPRRLCVCSG
jgi:hypothetical protein